ncbi:hypothetical protein RAS1_03880 [Phycisphaerae bacterium RAS1]|nr:hypothetical protein RAS1_03880 [Phycisphaerae bacterium RAS1]
MNWWRRWHAGPLLFRAPLKLLLLGITVGLVLYPKFWLVPAWLGRLGDMNAMIEPANPRLTGMEREARDLLRGDEAPPQVLKAVESVVYHHIPYVHDWDLWGVMDWLPTVDETLDAGREDCDGRAVIAASLLRRMGYDAWLISDLKHTWVGTPAGETMSPGKGPKSLVATSQGTRARYSLDTLANAARGAAYGMAAFPLLREAIIATAVCLLTLHPWSGVGRRVIGAGLILMAVPTLRAAGKSGDGLAQYPSLVWLGLAAALAGWLTLALRRRTSG